MTSIEEIRQRLQRKEDKWNLFTGVKKWFITPPITKFTLSDPERVVPYKDSILKVTANSYWVVDEYNNTHQIIESDEWDGYWMVKTAVPQYISEEERNLHYQGYLFGDASIIFTNAYGGSIEVLGSYKAPDGEIVKDIYINVPKGTNEIYISRYKNPPADVKINFEITYQNFTEFNVTEYVASWTDLEDLLERDMTTGVFESASFPIYLTGMAMDFMKEVFDIYMLHSKVAFNVYLRDDIKLNVYRLIKSAPMDFQTYKEGNTQVEISLVESDLNEQLNSQGKTKYDIPVSEVAEYKKWDYDRMTMLNRGNYTMTEQDGFAKPLVHEYLWLYMFLNSSEMTPGSPEHEFKTQNDAIQRSDDNYFFKTAKDESFDLTMNFHLQYKWKPNSPSDRPNIYLSIIKNNDTDSPLWSQKLDQSVDDEGFYIDEIVLNNLKENIELTKGDTLQIILQRDFISGLFLSDSKILFPEFTEFTLSYVSEGPKIDNIDVIKPETLCQNMLDRISGMPGRFACEFHWGDTTYKHMLCAAESIRNFQNANLHGSLNDLLDWMKVLGYEYSADGRVLVFKQRDEFFKQDVTALTLKGRENADLKVLASDKFAYTSLQIGYEAQDYESVNGRFEVNGMFEYATGYKNITSNVLKLISSYRADPIGIELLCWERKNSSKDTKSDNDIFAIAMKENEDHYSVYDDIVATPNDAPNMKMFNAVFNPYFLVKQNESLIGINSTYLTFTGTDSNRSSKIGDIDIYADQPIEKQLFKPYTYNFVTGNHIPLPGIDVRNGLIKFYHNNTLKSGFIQRILKNYSKETESTWILYAVQ